MKKTLFSLVLFLLLFAVSETACQQNKTTTIILLRHAEKDTVGGNDPSLSEVGRKRSAQLQTRLNQYTADAFYSTNLKRTKETLSPWAKAAGKGIEIYDAKEQVAFAKLLKAQTGKTIVVAGHSNTIPALVNLLADTNEYQQLPDSEYGKIVIVTINGSGKAEVKIETF